MKYPSPLLTYGLLVGAIVCTGTLASPQSLPATLTSVTVRTWLDIASDHTPTPTDVIRLAFDIRGDQNRSNAQASRYDLDGNGTIDTSDILAIAAAVRSLRFPTDATCDPIIETRKVWEGSRTIHTRDNPRARFYPSAHFFFDDRNGNYYGTLRYDGVLPTFLAADGTTGGLYRNVRLFAEDPVWDDFPTYPERAHVKNKYYMLGINHEDHLYYMLRNTVQRTAVGQDLNNYQTYKWLFTVDYHSMEVVHSQRIPETEQTFWVQKSLSLIHI